MKNYEQPALELIRFSVTDILLGSKWGTQILGPDNNGTGTGNQGGSGSIEGGFGL